MILINPKGFEKVLGQCCWDGVYDNQTNVSFEFGKPTLVVREARKRRYVYPKGQYKLWLFQCFWKIFIDGKEYIRLASRSYSKKDWGVHKIEGQKLIKVLFDTDNGNTIFEFDLDGRIECRRFDKESPVWELFTPNHRVIQGMGNGTIVNLDSRKVY